MNKALERSGVVRDEETGELYIPANQRPDGSWRKAIKVKEGYIPDAEMPRYECKGAQWLKSRPNLPPGLHLEDDVKSTNQNKPSKSALKKAKRKEKKEKDNKLDSETDNLASQLAASTIKELEPKNDVADKQKRLRSLRKKLKQINEMEEQMKANKSFKLEKEQLEKIQRKCGIEEDIRELEESD